MSLKNRIFYQKELLESSCPQCDICKKPRFETTVELLISNHKTIATSVVYKLCQGPKECILHCTCHLTIPKKLSISQILHVP